MDLKKTAIILVVFGSIFIVWNYPRPIKISSACEEPITYTIGIFDRRFGVSYQTFLNALAEAEAIWEKPVGKELFLYAPESAKLTVNLIHDYRQEATSVLSDIKSVVTRDETTYRALRERYLNLKTEYDDIKNIYDTRAEVLNEQNTAYQEEVESWNRSKRISREQFDRLGAKRTMLEKKVAELKILEVQLNQIAREINDLVGLLNRLAKSLNLNVETYNTIGASRGETFTGGTYHSVAGLEEIDVYEFGSRDKLVRVLAHELGHALGLEHIEDPEAMMYKLNEGDAKTLTKSDLTALRMLCGI